MVRANKLPTRLMAEFPIIFRIIFSYLSREPSSSELREPSASRQTNILYYRRADTLLLNKNQITIFFSLRNVPFIFLCPENSGNFISSLIKENNDKRLHFGRCYEKCFGIKKERSN